MEMHFLFYVAVLYADIHDQTPQHSFNLVIFNEPFILNPNFKFVDFQESQFHKTDPTKSFCISVMNDLNLNDVRLR